MTSLTFAIPAYNEEENLKWLVKDILKSAPKYKITDFEILIVDDGSTDKTGEIAGRLAKKYENVRVIHQSNRGYCGAMWRGIQEAGKDYVVYMPADGQTLVKDMVACFPHLSKADLILGDRGVRADYTRYRFALSYGYLFLLWLFFKIPYRDVNWFHIWRRTKVQKLKPISNSVFLLAEIVIRFRYRGLKIVETPVPYRQRYGGEVKNANFKVAWKTLVDLLKFWLLLRWRQCQIRK